MEYGDFYPHISILRSISDRKLGKNSLFKKTTLPDFNDFQIALTDLISASVVMEEGDPKHSQRRLILLTPIGKLIQALVKSVYEYHVNYSNFISNLTTKILVPIDETHSVPLLLSLKVENLESDEEQNNQRALKYRMENLGWTKEEIVYNRECLRNILDFKHIIESNFFFILIFRLRLIHLKFFPEKRRIKVEDQSTQQLLRSILFELMKELIFKTLDFKENRPLAIREFIGYPNVPLRDSYQYHMIPSRVHGGIFYLLYDMMSVFAYPLPFVLKEEIEKLLESYFSLIGELFIGGSAESTKEIFQEFGEDIKTEEKELQEIGLLSQDELEKYVWDGNTNWADYKMTYKNPWDYKNLKIRSMKLFEKYKGIFLGKDANA